MRAAQTGGRVQADRVLHLAVRVLTLPPIVIGITLLLMYASAAEGAVFAAHPHGGVSHT